MNSIKEARKLLDKMDGSRKINEGYIYNELMKVIKSFDASDEYDAIRIKVQSNKSESTWMNVPVEVAMKIAQVLKTVN